MSRIDLLSRAARLIVLVATIAVVGALARTESVGARPCPLPADSSDLGAPDQSIVRESVFHEGSCIAVHSGRELWSKTYYFHLTQPQLVAITLESDDFDSYLVHLNSNGTEIARDDDGGTGLDSRIERYLEAGRYTIETTKIDADPGRFPLQITGSAPASATQVAAQGACITQELGSVSGTVTRSGRLEAGDCIDEHSGKRFWADRYTFSLTERGRVEISLTSSDVSPYLAVVQPNGRIARDDNDGGVTRLSGSNVAPGLYRIEATKTQSGAGSYRLRIAVNAAEGAATADLHTLVVEANPAGGSAGYVEILNGSGSEPGQRNFTNGATANVRAVANHGWDFSHWSGDAEGTSARTTVRMDRSKRVIAVFASEGESPFGEVIQGPCTVVGGSGWSDTFPEAGWTDPQSVHEVKRTLARVLFGIPADTDPVRCAIADYNDFGEPHTAYGYIWGHSGWDVQTRNVAGRASANVPFYSLTRGEVVYVKPNAGSIVVFYDADGTGPNPGYTVYYIHARHSFVTNDATVWVGRRLGIQGDTGSPGAEHVHIEVHSGRLELNMDGAPKDTHGYRRGAINASAESGSGTLLRWHEQLNVLCEAATGGGSGCQQLTGLPESSRPTLGHLPNWPPQ